MYIYIYNYFDHLSNASLAHNTNTCAHSLTRNHICTPTHTGGLRGGPPPGSTMVENASRKCPLE